MNYFTNFPSVPVTLLEAPKYGISLFDLAFISEVMRRLHAHLFRRFIIYAQIGRLFGRRCVVIPDVTNEQEAYEKMTSIISHEGDANGNHSEIPLHTTRKSMIKTGKY